MPFNNELEQKSILTQDDRYFPLLIPKKRSPSAFLSQAMAVLNINQEDDGDRTTFFGIALRLTAAINVHGAFSKIDRWSSRTCIRERTLGLSYTLFFFVS
ncbi:MULTISPECIES: hypothetical protein [Microcystis]|jgi:hypothetical protein|uniref:hypothetical protein n=2 Tax=Microcystaceae TaxID=1890449 RepID=UPI001E59FB6A|nr:MULTISPECIES: hypothetical protein [Microcystis]MDJ0672666.1 hypothetical protein [Microcystis sp. M53598_WE2]